MGGARRRRAWTRRGDLPAPHLNPPPPRGGGSRAHPFPPCSSPPAWEEVRVWRRCALLLPPASWALRRVREEGWDGGRAPKARVNTARRPACPPPQPTPALRGMEPSTPVSAVRLTAS